MFFPASEVCSDSPQQGIPSEKWIIPQANAKEQPQAQEDGAVNEQCENLAPLAPWCSFTCL